MAAVISRSVFLRISDDYMGDLGVSTTRANTSTSTCDAFARSNARAQASTVAPDVSTSSTKISLRPITSDFPSAETWKAPCTFCARADLSSPTCWGVALILLSARCATARLLALATISASSADWLKRRAHYRRQCNGTGTSASTSASRARPALAIQRPSIGATSSRSPYFSACTRVRAISS